MTVNGTTTTLDTNLQEVDLINVQANSSTPAIGVTQSGSGAIIAAYDGASEVFRVDDGGNVGVGENSPSQRLHVSSTASTYIQVQNTGDSVNAYYGVDTASAWAGSSTNHPFKLHTNNTERLRITSGGNLNIGGNYTQTTYTTQITGTLNVTGNITQNGATVTTTGKAIAMAMIFG